MTMKTVTEHIRDHMLARIYTEPAFGRNLETFEQVIKRKWSPELEFATRKLYWSETVADYMKSRLWMGYFRYEAGPNWTQATGMTKYDLVGEERKRAQKYYTDGNAEYLVDASNYVLLGYFYKQRTLADAAKALSLYMGVFDLGEHPLHHFSAIDDGEHATPLHTEE